MAKALKIVGAIVAVVAVVATAGAALAAAGSIAATATTAATVGTFLGASAATLGTIASVATLASVGLSVASLAFKPKFSQQGTPTKFTTNPQSGIPYAIGRTRMSGLRIYGETWDAFKVAAEADILGFAVMLSGGGQIDSIEKFSADGEVIGFNPSTGASTNYNYVDWMAQKVWTGGPQTSALALTFGGKPFAGWTTAHKLSGITHALWALRFDKEGKHYGGGVPQPAWIGRWVRVYDPRLDSTYPGGSGACRALNETTYVWSRNPALHALTWALGRWQNGKKTFGIGAAVANIRVSDFVEAANVADVNKWNCGGVEWSTDSKWQTFKRMLQAGGCEPTMTGAIIGCRVFAPKVSITTINAANLHGNLQYSATRSKRDRINTIIPRYRSETHEWEIVSGTPVSVPAYVTADGRIRQKEYDLALVQAEYGQLDVDGEKQAGQLAAYEIVNAREAGPIRFTVGPEFVGLKSGDCVTLNVPDEGFSNTKILITAPPSLDPTTGLITLVADTETDSKHAFALGKTTVSPPPFTLTPPNLKPTTPVSTDWSVTAAGNSDGLPILLLTGGTSDGVFWDSIVVQYKRAADSAWIESGTYPDSTSLKVGILVDGATSYNVRIAYKNIGGYSDWLSLGPVTSLPADIAVIWGNIINDGGKPENNATRNIPAGVHSTSVAYTKGDIVRNAAGDATYIAKQNVPTGIAITNTVYWDLFVSGSGAPGENAISAFLTNASHVVSTASDGSGGVYTSAGGTMRVFDGFVEKTTGGSVTYAKVGTGTWYSIDSSGVYTITDPSADSATCQFDASYSGVTVRLTYSIAKSKQGTQGAAGTNGLPGANGTDGITYYTWFAYANSPTGTVDFTTGSPGNRAYIGIAANQTTATEGTDPTAYQWSAYKGPVGFGLNTSGGITVAGNSVIKSGGSLGWNADAYSTEGFVNGAYCSFTFDNPISSAMAGLNQDPATSPSYTSIDYAFHAASDGNLNIFESGSFVTSLGAYTFADVLTIQYDGSNIIYTRNGTVVRTVAVASGLTFYFDSSIEYVNARISNIVFGPAGPAGADGADGVDALSVSASIPIMNIACNFGGVPKTDQLPRTTQLVVYSGDINVASSATYSFTNTDCNVTNNGGGSFTLNSVSADNAYFDITATYASKSITMRISVSKVRDGSSASSATGAASINNTSSYTGTQGGPFTLPVGPNGTITLDAVVNYYTGSGSGSATLYGKWQYRITPGSGGWTDIGTEVAGDTVIYLEPGSLIVNDTLSGPTSAANWEFQFLNRRTGSASATDNGNSVATVTWGP